MNETDLRDRLTRAAASLLVREPSMEQLVERGKRKRLVRQVTAGVTAIVVLTASSWALFSLRRLDPSKPADSSLPAVTRFDMDGRPIRQVAVGYGAAWFTVQDAKTRNMALARIDETTGEVIRVAAAGQAGYVAVGAGSVWTATCANPDQESCQTRIVRIDPTTLEAIAEIPMEGPIWGMAFGAGSLWVMTRQYIEGLLIRVDPGLNRVVAKIGEWACCSAVAVCCSGVTVGEVAVWGLGSIGRRSGELTKLDPMTEDVTRLPSLRPRFRFGGHHLAVGQGVVWVAVDSQGGFPLGGSAVAKIDPATGMITAVFNNVGPGRFVAGHGAMWMARVGDRAGCVELLHLSPSDASIRVLGVVAMGEARYQFTGPFGPSIGVGLGGDTAWITIDQTYEVIRVDLSALGSEPVVDPECRASPSN